MPVYKNLSGMTLRLGDKDVKSGKVVDTMIWHQESPSLTKVNDAPMYNPIVLSVIVTKDTVIQIPYRDKYNAMLTRFLVHIYVGIGEPEIFVNSENNTPPLKLYPSAKWNYRCYERTIDNIRIKLNDKPGKVWVIVEKI